MKARKSKVRRTRRLQGKTSKKAKKTLAEEPEYEDEYVEEAKFVGCFVSEGAFERIYDGGATGANFNLALHHAKTIFAVARAVSDGHSFALMRSTPTLSWYQAVDVSVPAWIWMQGVRMCGQRVLGAQARGGRAQPTLGCL